MKTLLNEDDPQVVSLSRGKTKLRTGGLVSIYRLNNGWIARRQEPENNWARSAYWNIYPNRAAEEANEPLGGGEGRLTRAIANVLNYSTE